MTNNKEYSISLRYSIGSASGYMSWNSTTSLNGELLEEMINELKDELGTTKDVFIESVSVTKNTDNLLDDHLLRLNVEI